MSPGPQRGAKRNATRSAVAQTSSGRSMRSSLSSILRRLWACLVFWPAMFLRMKSSVLATMSCWPLRQGASRARGPLRGRRRTRSIAPGRRGSCARPSSIVDRQVLSRNARSWLTTSTAPRKSESQLLEPVDRVEVEVVGGFVEQQHVRLLREDDAEPQPSALATREGRDRALQIWSEKPRWLASAATLCSSSSPRARW